MGELQNPAQNVERFKKIPAVVGGLPHPHELHLGEFGFDRDPGLNLREHLGARQLAHEPGSPRHAEAAPDGAADLGRDAEALPREHHAFDQFPIRELREKLVARDPHDARDRGPAGFDLGNRVQDRLREVRAVGRLHGGAAEERAHDAAFVFGLGARGAKVRNEVLPGVGSGHGCGAGCSEKSESGEPDGLVRPAREPGSYLKPGRCGRESPF